MPSRKFPLVAGEYYHVFNRGVNKLPIFNGLRDYQRFIKSMLYYQLQGPKPRFSLFTPTTLQLDKSKKIVEIVCFCLMPNHIHFLLKQVSDKGVTEFMGKLSNSYTKYVNIRSGRVGPLLQGEFKSVLMESNEQLLHLSRYIHLNPLIAGIVDDLGTYVWSSYGEYVSLQDNEVSRKDIISDQFKSREDYKQFVLDQESYGRELDCIKHQLLDPDY